MTPFCYNYQNPSGFWKEGCCRFKPYWGFKFECKRKRDLIREVIFIYLCNCNLPACLKRELHTMLLTMGGGCDCCRDIMWRREEKRWYTVHSSSRYKIRRRTLLRPCDKSPPPLPCPVRPTFSKFASNFLLRALKSQHKEICPLRCVMTFPVGLRLFMSVAIDQLKNVKFGFTKLSLKPLSDLRKTEGY